MPFATCPQCDERIRFADMPDIGDIVTCRWCDARLEVVSLNPIVLDWPFELDEDDEEDDNAEFDSATERYSGATSQYQVNGQATGLWYYRVRASNSGGNSAWSNVQSVGVVPAAPTLADISNEDGNGDYLVSWRDVAEVKS